MDKESWFAIQALRLGRWLYEHPLGLFTGLSAFVVSCWASLTDGHGWARSMFGGVVCVFITLAVIAVMTLMNVNNEWMPIVGVFVGFIGADRIRDAILAAWEVRRQRLQQGQVSVDNMDGER